MNSEYMPKGGVKELVRSAEGRRYLARLQKKYELDIIQPSDPRFRKVYGKKLQEQQRIKNKQAKIASDEWNHLQELKKHDQMKQEGIKSFY